MPCRKRGIAAGATLVEVLVVIAIIAVLVGLTLPAVQRVREAASRAGCANHLRQVGLAAHNYHAAREVLPVGVTVPADGADRMAYLSWQSRLLPYLEQDAVWRQAEEAYRLVPDDFRSSPPHPFTTVVRVFGCPADGRTAQSGMARGQFPAAFTSYLGVSGTRTARRDGVLFRNSRVRIADIADGASCTLFAGERPPSGDLWYGWWYAGFGADGNGKGDMLLGVMDVGSGSDPRIAGCPADPPGFRTGSVGNVCDAFHFWSLHPGGGHFLFADGSTRFLSYGVGGQLVALATRAGGEVSELP